MDSGRYGYKGTGRSVLIGLAVAVFVIIVGFGWFVASNYTHLGNLFKVVMLIRTQYISKSDYGDMMEGAIKGVVQSLNDPYSVYLDPVTYKQLQDQLRGSFGGLGILVGMKDGHLLTVARTYSGTPAYQAGLQAGDVISKIDDREVSDIDLETAVQLMRGPVGTKLSLTIVRANTPKPIVVDMTRQEITVPTVEGEMVKDGIAHIVISQFSENTAEELGNTLEKLKKQNMRGIILDLRDNPGGELDSAVKVASYFVPAGPVVYIEYKGGRTEVKSADGNNLKLPLVVLVNGGSASASEIVSGAIKDTGSGILVGQKTFGKGVVQSIFDLGNGAGLKLTIARYLTPNKNDINKKGIIPDVVVEQKPGDDKDIQLQRALNIISSKLGSKAA